MASRTRILYGRVELVRGVSPRQRKPWPSSESHNVMIERSSIPVSPSASHPGRWVNCGLTIGLLREFQSLRVAPTTIPPSSLGFGTVGCGGLVVCRGLESSSSFSCLSAISERDRKRIPSRRDRPVINRFVGFDRFAGHRLSRPCGVVVCRIGPRFPALLTQQAPSDTEDRHCSEKARESQRAVAEPCRKRTYQKVRVVWRKVDVVEQQEEQQKGRKSSGLKGCAARNNLYSPPCDG
jgi:hypothetical protein